VFPRAYFAIHRAALRVAGLLLLKTWAYCAFTEGFHDLPGAGLRASLTSCGAVTPGRPIADCALADWLVGTHLAAGLFVWLAVLAAELRMFKHLAFAGSHPALFVKQALRWVRLPVTKM